MTDEEDIDQIYKDDYETRKHIEKIYMPTSATKRRGSASKRTRRDNERKRHLRGIKGRRQKRI